MPVGERDGERREGRSKWEREHARDPAKVGRGKGGRGLAQAQRHGQGMVTHARLADKTREAAPLAASVANISCPPSRPQSHPPSLHHHRHEARDP